MSILIIHWAKFGHLLLFVSLTCSFSQGQSRDMEAKRAKQEVESKILFFNGQVWQWSPNSIETGIGSGHTVANWFTIIRNAGDEEDKFGQVGEGDPPEDVLKRFSEKINLAGSIVLPGLMDAHIHVSMLGESSYFLDLEGCGSIEELQSRLKDHADKYPEQRWIQGIRWDQSSWGRYPNRHDLDKVVGDRPVFLQRACWHIAVANTAAMELAHLCLDQKIEVEGGQVDYDSVLGECTGIFREKAVRLIWDKVEEPEDSVRLKHFEEGLQQCLQSGLTAVQTNDKQAWEFYKTLQEQGKLPLRVFLTIMDEDLEKQSYPESGCQEGALLRCDRLKLFADGSLGAETAALRKPYKGTDNLGILIYSDEELLQKVTRAHEQGYRLEVHAIGDRAAEQVLTAFEEAGLRPQDRPVLTHCQVLGDDIINKMAELGVIANIQPPFVSTDCNWVKQRLSAKAQEHSYCWRTLMQRGVMCAGGSDAPVETCDPLTGIYDAIFRFPKESSNTEHKETFMPSETLTFGEALWLYTKGAAFACNCENKLGEVKEGFLADFVILDSPSLLQDPSQVKESSVRQVWVNGSKRYDNLQLQPGQGNGSTVPLSGDLVPGKNGPRYFLSSKVSIKCRCCM